MGRQAPAPSMGVFRLGLHAIARPSGAPTSAFVTGDGRSRLAQRRHSARGRRPISREAELLSLRSGGRVRGVRRQPLKGARLPRPTARRAVFEQKKKRTLRPADFSGRAEGRGGLGRRGPGRAPATSVPASSDNRWSDGRGERWCSRIPPSRKPVWGMGHQGLIGPFPAGVSDLTVTNWSLQGCFRNRSGGRSSLPTSSAPGCHRRAVAT
jgi:hypothetical protein